MADLLPSTQVTKPVNGSLIGTFAAGDGCRSPSFDGANVWTANQFANSASKL